MSYNPLVAIADQLCLLVHATVVVSPPSTTGAQQQPSAARAAVVDFTAEAKAYERLKAVVTRAAANAASSAAGNGLELRAVWPWKIGHDRRPADAAAAEAGEAAVGAKSDRRADAGDSAFPTVALDGYGTVAFTIACGPHHHAALTLGAVQEALKAIRVQQLLKEALRRNTAATSGSTATATATSTTEVLIDSIGFIDASLAEALPTRSFAPMGGDASDAKRSRTEGAAATATAAPSSAEEALEDKLCAVLVEGFLDHTAVAPPNATPEELAQRAAAMEERMNVFLVPATIRETIPMLEGFMRQTYGARLVPMHPQAARDAFLSSSSSSAAPLGAAAVASASAIAAAVANPLAVTNPATNPFTVHCFFDFSASTTLAKTVAAADGSAAPQQQPVTGLGKMYLAFLPSHPQAEAYAQHLRTMLHNQKVFNNNPIRVNSVSGKQFVRALKGAKSLVGQ